MRPAARQLEQVSHAHREQLADRLALLDGTELGAFIRGRYRFEIFLESLTASEIRALANCSKSLPAG